MKENQDAAPLISVIIPTFQAEETLRRVLTSVTEQTFQNYEVLIIDGGSKDRTLKFASTFCDKFSQVRCFCEPDQGVFDAMNKGIEKANGKWLYFLGADDYLFANETLEQVSKNLQDDLGVVYGNVESTRWNGLYDGEFDVTKILNKNICHQAIFFHRTVFGELGIFDHRYPYAADWEFNFRWMLSPKIKNRFIDQIIANYADGGLSSQNRDKRFEQDRMLLYVYHGRHILDWKMQARIISKEMRRSLRELRPSLFLRSHWALLSIAAQRLQRTK